MRQHKQKQKKRQNDLDYKVYRVCIKWMEYVSIPKYGLQIL